ncbi:MAG: LD-carboxypeptidase [Gammaproteobacteria bacterium]|nr:LD-carboxypeptidase [Gammaproteobacteria bacterium]
MNDLLHSPKLKKGDLVRLVSPASYPDQSGIDEYISALKSWGLRCDTGEHVLSKFGFMAGTDAERLKDLNEAFRDPLVRAIITTRGGAGAYKIADDIDFKAVRADPKPLVGFSDITSLHLSLFEQCRVGGIHGCLYGTKAQFTVRQLLMTTESIILKRMPEAVSAQIRFPGTAQGRLIGGNLQMVATSIGVRMPNMKGAILFLEYHRAGLGTIDRYLTQLLRSGALEGIVGVALGSFESAREHIDRGWSVVDVLNDRLGKLNVPVLGGIYAGHDLTGEDGNHDQSAVPLGSLAKLNVEKGTLEVESLMC